MPRNYIKVFGERAVRLVEDRLRDNLGVSETRVIADTAMKLGTSREPLRRWVMRARVDAGVRPRVSTEESAELKRLRQENAELRRTNEILKLASHPQCSGEMTHKNCASREVISSCHDLWYVKQSFRMSKTDLRARPIFHHTQEAIEAHLTFVFTALAVVRGTQSKTGLTLKKAIQELLPLRHVTMRIAGHDFIGKPAVTLPVQAILKTLKARHTSTVQIRAEKSHSSTVRNRRSGINIRVHTWSVRYGRSHGAANRQLSAKCDGGNRSHNVSK